MSLSQSLLSARHHRCWSVLAAALLLSACSSVPQQSVQRQAVLATVPQTASTLGTQWGEGRESRVYSVQAQPIEPQRDELQLTYSDERSIYQALGRNLDAQRSILLDQGKVELSVHDGRDVPLTIYSSIGQKNYQLAGKAGERYVLVYTNRSSRPYEIVTTVDGLDVLSGKPGSRSHNGYLLQAGAVLRIEGFRKSADEVAAFRFSPKDRSYAANTLAGDARNIGVIGTVLYEVRPVTSAQPAVRSPNPFPADKGNGHYAPAPRY
ncbi:hypothetical protein [Alcaligenes faecalis]|uniref:hypothetical protein n=1 Tax=Alcaligenes faecalis TaxID=511 RepID=UPI002932F2BE|nr:hypothetical protein [Alcaligenes faecalis]MDV2116683.1 hypothetical protein [Alcaligenes faecalis]